MRSKHTLPDLLFFGQNSFQTFEQRKAALSQSIANLSRDEIATRAVDEIIASIIG